MVLAHPIGTTDNFCPESCVREATLGRPTVAASRLREPAGRWAGKTLGIWGQIKETRDGVRLD